MTEQIDTTKSNRWIPPKRTPQYIMKEEALKALESVVSIFEDGLKERDKDYLRDNQGRKFTKRRTAELVMNLSFGVHFSYRTMILEPKKAVEKALSSLS